MWTTYTYLSEAASERTEVRIRRACVREMGIGAREELRNQAAVDIADLAEEFIRLRLYIADSQRVHVGLHRSDPAAHHDGMDSTSSDDYP